MVERSPTPHYQLKIFGLVVGLVTLALTATAFTIFIIQTQSAVGAYISGQSAWSRGQLTAVYNLDRYARTGSQDYLEAFHQSIAVPLADLEARKGMERETLDMVRVRERLIEGLNHPDDIPSMIWLFRNFADYSHFKLAADAWRASDAGLTELLQVARQLEEEWAKSPIDAITIEKLQRRTEQLNYELDAETELVRQTIGDAGRFTKKLLTWAGIAFITLVSLGTWLMGLRLLRLLRRSEHRFRAIFEQSSIGILQLNATGEFLDANPASCKILEYPQRTIKTLSFQDIIHPEDRPGLYLNPDGSEANLPSQQNLEKRIIKGNGETIWARITASLVSGGQHHHSYYILMLEDISEAYRLSRELNHQATHDVLTDLLNRRAFEHRLASVLGRARTDRTSHALGFVDLDRFKAVNDTSGHAAGDQLLRQVSEVIRSCIRDGDVLARLGGDEFGLILENCDLDTAAKIFEKLRGAIEQLVFSWNDRQHTIGCCIGVVPIEAGAPDISTLMRAADQACYSAKRQGRNRVYLGPVSSTRDLNPNSLE
ncbi:GGDEF domain-containing protein [Marinobacter zhejiangensis]|uniref:PAS domain S-box-containing protein/diguanylate cyclase (GGDEF) domain-containing protein n=1 Tax=Marinobacter zhejiangensis TaxID=488535 RepID=A0A1I4QBF1_9GAMM|nr:GGDEF domain-containing protein [Marinobacter zhejiangensis]SFM36960.1 PAS domain S-box-containing protein/diguanylate cyclase (GGDEF) domain-containing protein [Marinobacter zhejiangensis]